MNRRERIKFKEPFYQWTGVKIGIEMRSSKPRVSEGEIWWCGMGKNVGVEINGKNENFSRPVIVYHVFGRLSFLAVPLTTKPKTGSWYVPFQFHGRTETAVLCQIKSMSTTRVYERIGKIDKEDFAKVEAGLIALLAKKCPQPLD